MDRDRSYQRPGPSRSFGGDRDRGSRDSSREGGRVGGNRGRGGGGGGGRGGHRGGERGGGGGHRGGGGADRAQKRGRDESFRGRGGGGNNKRLRTNMRGQGRPKPAEKPEFRDDVTTATGNVQKRVQPGINDKTVELIANFHKITFTDEIIRMYAVKFDPPIDRNKGLKFKICKLAEAADLGRNYIFNGEDMLYTVEDFSDRKKFDLTVDGRPYNMSLKFIRIVDPSSADWKVYRNTKFRDVLRNVSGFLEIDKKYFLEEPTQITEHRIEIFSGAKSTIRNYDAGTLINLSASSRILNTTTVYDAIRESRRMGGDARQLIGAVVITMYNRMTYKISAVEFNENPSKEFEQYDGTRTTIANYFMQHYRIQIQDMRQPLLKTKPTAKDARAGRNEEIDLVPELCHITGLDDQHRRNEQLMERVAAMTKRNPRGNIDFLTKYMRPILDDGAMNNFRRNGMFIEPSLLRIKDCRVIKSDMLVMRDKNGEEKKVNAIENNPKVKESQKFFNGVKLEDWYFICPNSVRSFATRFLEEFKRANLAAGNVYRDPDTIWIHGGGHEKEREYKEEVEAVLRTTPKPKFIMMVIIDDGHRNNQLINSRIYADFKRQTMSIGNENDRISTQVVKDQMMRMPKAIAVAQSIAMQVTCKMGGLPWFIDLIFDDMLIIGIDVSIRRENNQRKVFSGFFAHLNPMHQEEIKGRMTYTGGKRYFSSTHHDRGLADVSGIVAPKYFKSCIMEYKKHYNSLPKKIVMYRDGANDGDIETIIREELNQIDAQISQLGESWKPEFLFIIVNKKSNARFYRKDERGNFTNPEPGTIIDTEVTLPGQQDFYMISQDPDDTKTFVPIYYKVIRADFLKDDPSQMEVIQNLTFLLTKYYFNWRGGVRVPSVCQYSKKLARLSSTATDEIESSLMKDMYSLSFL